MKIQDDPTPPPSNAFVRVLQTHAKGEMCNELAEAQRQCIEAVTLTGKPATMTITVKVMPAAKGAYAIEFAPTKVKLPVLERSRSLWYGDEEHNLHREDPRQKELPVQPMADHKKAVNN
jgi:hypothetical protein